MLAVGLIAMLFLGGLPVSSVPQRNTFAVATDEPGGMKGLKGVVEFHQFRASNIKQCNSSHSVHKNTKKCLSSVIQTGGDKIGTSLLTGEGKEDV
jgi:hypothetical protein